jgi:hypothetical protein
LQTGLPGTNVVFPGLQYPPGIIDNAAKEQYKAEQLCLKALLPANHAAAYCFVSGIAISIWH